MAEATNMGETNKVTQTGAAAESTAAQTGAAAQTKTAVPGEKSYTCIVCPRGCRLTVRETPQGLAVTGNTCKRGETYARAEYTDPRRTLTSTVKLTGARLVRLPVITSQAVPRAQLPAVLDAVMHLCVQAPVQCGQVLVHNIAGTQADLLASRSVSAN